MKTNSIFNSLLFMASLAFLQACGTKGESSENSIPRDAIPVRTIPIEKTLWNEELKCSGQFTTDDETLLSFKTGGLVNSILVEEGDYVKKGQLLATLNQTEIAAGVNQARLSYEKALRDYERVERLKKDSVATTEQVENTKTALDIAKQQLKAVEFNQIYSEIRAVSEGYVLKKFVNQGQVVSSCSPILQTNGAGKSDWKLQVGISDKEWAMISEGDSAIIFTDALPGRKIVSRVSSKSMVADPYSGTFTIELSVDNEFGKSLAAGMFGAASIFPSTERYSWSVPYEALLDANAGEAFVFVSDGGEKALKVEVTIGAMGKDKVQIIEGLEGHKNLIISGSAYLKDQSLISILQ